MLDALIKVWAGRRAKPLELEPDGKARGTVAISYLTWPLAEGWDSPRARGHTNAFEVVAMAEAWKKGGFRVEVCDYTDTSYRPPPDCQVALDLHSNLERWVPDLPVDCLKILHATGCHWRVHNRAELDRLDALEERRGVRLRPRRQVDPNRAAEIADEIMVLGNEYTIGTYAFAGTPITRIPISSAYAFPWPEHRDFDQAKRRFLWLGSYGMVHKGLDLVLEAFAGMPDLELTVCGRPEKEDDFFRLYQRELQQTGNIHWLGWVDLGSPQFAEIARTHSAVLYPSCAEGGGGAVIHCMNAGLIPVCTQAASVDLEDFGLVIPHGGVTDVQTAARRVAGMSPAEVEERAVAARHHVCCHHTRETFALNYGKFVRHLTDGLPSL